jgi:hypothetical protein
VLRFLSREREVPMMADLPIDSASHPPPSPSVLLSVLDTILSTPPITNADAATADAWINFDGLSIEESTYASVLAAARYCFQAGGLQLSVTPHLTVVE